jgi:hypothetical protein
MAKDQQKWVCGHGNWAGTQYLGEWNSEGKRHGQGKMKWKNDEAYEGHWREDKRHGKGTMIYKNKYVVYTGDWAGDRREGFGKMTFKEKCVYEGQWKNNKMEGTGTFTWPRGKILEILLEIHWRSIGDCGVMI